VPNIKVQKDVNELLELQDRAIQALQQATLALQIALQALQDSRVEKGDQQKMVFVPVPAPNPFYTTPTEWPGSTTICGLNGGYAGAGNFQVYNGSAEGVVMSAMSTVQTASNFACAGGSNK
jgi:hypothetical protein